MAVYNSVTGYQTLIELIEPFFKSRGYSFHIPPYEMWLDKQANEGFYKSRNWNTYLQREHEYKWYKKEDDFDAYFSSGYFARKLHMDTEMIQLNMTPRKTIVPVFGIDIPGFNNQLNELARKIPAIRRITCPFSTLYHDMMYSTWSGRPEDAKEVFLCYGSVKQMSESIDKIETIYTNKMLPFFQITPSEELFQNFIDNNYFDFKKTERFVTLENEEYILWYFLLTKKYGKDTAATYSDIKHKIDSADFNETYTSELHSLNARIHQAIIEE